MADLEPWDKIIRLAGERAAASTPRDPGNRRVLRLLESPERRYLPDMERRIDLIEPNLRACLRELVGGRAPWPLFLYGVPGSGKTCAVLALCDWCAGSSIYRTADQQADMIAEEWREERTDAFRGVDSAALVVLDELGLRVKDTDLGYRAVKEVCDRRTVGKQCGTVYVSNVRPEEISAVYDDRIASRILSGTQFETAAVDRRFS